MTVTAGAKSRVGRYKRGGTGERLLAGRREGGTGEKILTRRYCWKVTGGGSTGGKIPAGRYWRLVIARRYRRGVHEPREVYILQESVSHQGEPPPGRDNMAPVTTLTDFTVAFIIYG